MGVTPHPSCFQAGTALKGSTTWSSRSASGTMAATWRWACWRERRPGWRWAPSSPSSNASDRGHVVNAVSTFPPPRPLRVVCTNALDQSLTAVHKELRKNDVTYLTPDSGPRSPDPMISVSRSESALYHAFTLSRTHTRLSGADWASHTPSNDPGPSHVYLLVLTSTLKHLSCF